VVVQAFGNTSYGTSNNFGVLVGERPKSASPVDAGTLVESAPNTQGYDVGGENTLACLAKYPPTIQEGAAGVIYVIAAPAWMVNSGGQEYQDLKGPELPPNSAGRFGTFAERAAGQAAQYDQQETAKQTMMQYIAKYSYCSHYLKMTAASLRIPLCCAVRVGRTYKIQSVDGVALFTGYLHSLRHEVTIGQEGSIACTYLSFTHILAAGSKIYGVNAVPPDPQAITVPPGGLFAPDQAPGVLPAVEAAV
jgi:hypothetical protein